MLNVTQLSGFGSGEGGGITLLEAITLAGLTSNLELCLDAADAASYTSGQSWLDRSGLGQDFFLGATNGAEATDPTFTGPVGSKDIRTYWAFDGGDYFTYDTTNPTWVQNLHKNNAAFTIIAAIYSKTGGSSSWITATRPQGTGTGIVFGHNAASDMFFNVLNAGASVFSMGSSNDIGYDRWNIVAVSVAEATPSYFLYANGNVGATSTTAYSSPSVGNATSTIKIGAQGDAAEPLLSGSRLAFLGAWSAALSEANLDELFALMRGRFGI